ncbi:hypothetical protein ACFXKF_36375 [Streptomyces scopuliridis]|uniref:hypothetical protein n=1 Tax=Streptomyces scopuliridis TaxID=452529 RepID=UPI00369E0D20
MTDQPTPPPCTREAVLDALTHRNRPLKRYDVIVQMYWRNNGTAVDRIYDLPTGSAVAHMALINAMLKDGALVQLSGPKWRQILGPEATPPSVHPGTHYLATKDQFEEWTTPRFTVIGLRRDMNPSETLVSTVLDFAVPERSWCTDELRSDTGWTRMRTIVRARTAAEAERTARAQWSAAHEDHTGAAA